MRTKQAKRRRATFYIGDRHDFIEAMKRKRKKQTRKKVTRSDIVQEALDLLKKTESCAT